MTAVTPIKAIDPKAFRQTLGCFPTGVAVVTTQAEGEAPIGLTISSFNSVSMDPPLVLWSLALKAASLPIFRASPGFAINILSERQADVPAIFSSPVDERFDHVAWTPGLDGHPVLDDAAAVIECKTFARYDGGDHEIMIGQVLRHRATDLTPLVYGKGRLGPLQLSA